MSRERQKSTILTVGGPAQYSPQSYWRDRCCGWTFSLWGTNPHYLRFVKSLDPRFIGILCVEEGGDTNLLVRFRFWM
jgi:hypothetical protein